MTKAQLKIPTKVNPRTIVYPLAQVKFRGAKKKGTKGSGYGVATFGHDHRDREFLKSYTNGPESLILEEVDLVAAFRHDYNHHKPVLMKGTEDDYMDAARELIGENLERQSNPPIWRTEIKFPPGSVTLDTENLDPGSEGKAVQAYWDSTLCKDEAAGVLKSEPGDMDAEGEEEFFDTIGGDDDDDDDSSDDDDESFASSFPEIEQATLFFYFADIKERTKNGKLASKTGKSALEIAAEEAKQKIKAKKIKAMKKAQAKKGKSVAAA